MNRRVFLCRASAVAVVTMLAPRDALVKVTPPEAPDDAAEIQAMIDRSEVTGEPVLLQNRTYTLRRPIVLRGSSGFRMEGNHITATGRYSIDIKPGASNIVIRNSVFDMRPSLLQRVLNRFAA